MEVALRLGSEKPSMLSVVAMKIEPSGEKRLAFKGFGSVNLEDHLQEVLRWALGSIEIFLSRHCPIWYGYGGGLKLLERIAYINVVVYLWTSIRLFAYCTLPAVCLFNTGITSSTSIFPLLLLLLLLLILCFFLFFFFFFSPKMVLVLLLKSRKPAS
ncbi:hypothetical protein J1N35_007027 [Gossypium stocksii]|uniref:Uncharacterized protein n=1 Tax=Gossypium stocksii TaxID=47602 RepID=A0A9D3W591_9ROSI|nr:hypothetical protein J1N35_007027 [Gossypium stocksii]